MLPGAWLGPALIAALWMLFAPHRSFSQWGSAEDAVDSMHDAQACAGDSTPQAAVVPGSCSANVLASMHSGSEPVIPAWAWLPKAALLALLRAVDCRAACYPVGPAAPRLTALLADGVCDRTLCAALTLIAEEQDILEVCLKSIRNYTASPRRKRSRPSNTL